ncbi:efflux RND transporter periplasmic adaptor subunit [Nibribacter ruber]|uniref:Efflux RND transporter periplasmic adaptor subunit n=1 Tax=Nibribacter ruber TaxID=2698458 RepID=A0A6P1P4C5_9BACT|nr:efflux RND transporter periplasmic adaptor subunit [Nibribacter ruber]QHL89270.1 efflux RND transporter periplasmic adaptor subunit [Nibribacter ruber]
MKKLLYILVAVVLIGAVAYTLNKNKKEMTAKAAVAEIKSEAIPVTLTQVENAKLDKSFTAQGNFEPIQSLTLVSEISGQIQKVYKRKGDKVRAGELLLQVEDNTSAANLATANANYQKALKDLERMKNLIAGDAVTKRQLEEAQINVNATRAQLVAARQNQANTRVTAPINGQINAMYIEVGSYLNANAGTRLYDIVNVDRLKLNVKVSESEVLLINRGQKVKVTANAGGAQEYEGTVTAIGAAADASLKYDVEIEVKNTANNNLRAGMYGTAFFPVNAQRDALLLPREAIVGSIQDPSVWVVSNDKASLRKVKVGIVTQDQVEILDGVQPGENIVRTGQINLREGIQVTTLK